MEMNKTIKIIDLLNKIANGEEPSKKIKYDGRLYHLNVFKNNYFDDLDCSFIDFKNIHDTVEIIEDNDKLEKIKWDEKESRAGILRTNQEIEVLAKRTETLKKKIAELVEHINKIEERLDER